MSNNNGTSDIVDDEIFLKNLLKDFYRTIIELEDYIDFEKISIDWINHKLEKNDKDPNQILKVMKNHENCKSWFTSLIGFFYQLGIGCDVDKKM